MKYLTKRYLAVAIASCCHSVWADDIEEVVVTGSLFAPGTEVVSHPASTLTGGELQAAASSTLGDTLSGQLGVSSASFGPGVGIPIIRGQTDNRVKVMQDSVGSMDASSASPDHAITLEPLLATKIEVLRGPAALRYGSGAIGGVVNVLDNRIPDALPVGITGGAELRSSSANNETNGVINLNGASENVALHVDAIKRDSGNLKIPNYAKTNPSPNDTKGIEENTDAQTTSGTLGGSYIGDAGFIGMSVNKLDNNYGVPPEGDERVRIDMHQTRYDVKGEINNPTDNIEKIRAHIGHADYEHTEMEGDVKGTKFTNNAYEGRFEIVQKSESNYSGAMGLQLSRSLFAAIGDEAFIPKSDIRNGGLFVVEEITHKNVTYELGARGDYQTISPENMAAIQHRSANISGTTTWHLNDDQELTFGLAQSQRAPSIEELLANGPHPATGSYLLGDENLNEETSHNLEAGYHWHTENLHATVNIFYNHIRDFIYSNNFHIPIDGLNEYEYTQSNATFKGYEAEMKMPVNQQWNLRIFSDAVRATLDEGGDLPRITPMRFGSELDYDNHQLNCNLTLTHTSKQLHPGDFETASDSYTRIDSRIGYTFSQSQTEYLVFLKANNITNTEIRNATSYLRNIAPEAGRNIQLGMRITF